MEMAVRTRAIVRLRVENRMVTKGYQKGVYVRVTLGISGANRHIERIDPRLCFGGKDASTSNQHDSTVTTSSRKMVCRREDQVS